MAQIYLFAIISKSNLVLLEVLITHVTNKGMARELLPMDPFGKHHKLVHDIRFPNVEVLLLLKSVSNQSRFSKI